MQFSLFDYLFIFYHIIPLVFTKSLICHRLECASQGVDWICGSDGQDYLNQCELERIRCFGVAIQVHSRGKCPRPLEKQKRRISSDIEVEKRKSECNKQSWEKFKRSLTKFWRKDYFRKPRPGADISLSIEKRVLHYNFDRIDTNKDEHISSAEWKFHRTNGRHSIRSKCSRDLILRCDQDFDRLISRVEWMQCLYISPTNFNTQWYHPKSVLNDEPKKTEKSKKPTIIVENKQKPALLIDKRPCYSLSGNSSLDKFAYRTDCNIQLPTNPLNVNCTAEKNLHFLQMLFSQFKTEMIYVGQMPTGGIKSGRRQVAAWKFKQLDANHDELIQRHEWRLYRQFIKQWDGVRKCGRSFFRGCDSNHDKQIDTNEWNACTVRAYEQASITPRLDRNPFLYLLKPET